jgi:Protein of unknown function (DUF3024)
MALSQIHQTQVTKRLTAFCEARVPATVRDKIRVGFRIKGNEVVLFEMAAAKLKYIGTQGVWRLYCQHRDRRWHVYEALPEASSFAKLLDEVSDDPTGIFWG